MLTLTGTLRGSVIELDAPPDPAALPDGGRVRLAAEPEPDAPAPAPAGLSPGSAAARQVAAFEKTFGVMKDHPEEVDAFDEMTRRLRRMTREEARRLRGED